MAAREGLQDEQAAKLLTLSHAIDFQEGNVKDFKAQWARRSHVTFFLNSRLGLERRKKGLSKL